MTKFEISSSLSSSTSLQVFVQQALKSLEERKKKKRERRSYFLHHDQTVQMLCLAYITSDIPSHVSNQWEHTNFLLWSANFWILRALLSTTAAQERRRCRQWTLPAAIFGSTPRHCGSLGDPSSSWIPVPQIRKKKKNREKRKTMH